MDKPIVFTDFHHASLLNSLIMLFENRMQGKIFRPIGMEWAERGFWKVYDHPATQAQYLSTGSTPIDGTRPLNNVLREYYIGEQGQEPDVYLCQDIDSGNYNKAITFDGFMKLKIDIVIATLPQHIEPYYKLTQIHPSRPKLIYQIGNAWNVPDNSPVHNVMMSAVVPNIPSGINVVSYHQEFDTNIFTPHIPNPTEAEWQIVRSFVNCFNAETGYMLKDYTKFLQVENAMTDWKFEALGGQCRDGAAHGTQSLANKMRESRFIWHTKNGGDGYGHVIHNTAAVARPLIVNKSYYSGKLGDKLLIDGKTCIVIDNLSVNEIVNKILYYNQAMRYADMCKNVYDNFKIVVDFDKEYLEIQKFIQNLI